jgi:hypothetical protein
MVDRGRWMGREVWGMGIIRRYVKEHNNLSILESYVLLIFGNILGIVHYDGKIR